MSVTHRQVGERLSDRSEFRCADLVVLIERPSFMLLILITLRGFFCAGLGAAFKPLLFCFCACVNTGD